MGFVQDAYANAILADLTGASRFLAITTDLAGTTESTDYDGRIDISTLFDTPASGSVLNDVAVGPFTWTAGETVRGYAICDDVSDPISTSGLTGGALDAPITVGAAGTVTFAIGDAGLTVTNPG